MQIQVYHDGAVAAALPHRPVVDADVRGCRRVRHRHEPVVNTFVPSLDKLIDTVTEWCRTLTTRQPEISSRTIFAWWPKNYAPS